ncbi:hypothetical protein H6G97_41055 [Nostoc flagelliforme FACHB-838]|uniref:Uncharacterized protein n=1 Tax=Nostoc flagelliforme FACHB-838 TaxID=2692904 RepID=A0ABR8E1U3_9NOSO|nr:hypothetical protein [Nostoc flagelliforme FACHB-838]
MSVAKSSELRTDTTPSELVNQVIRGKYHDKQRTPQECSVKAHGVEYSFRMAILCCDEGKFSEYPG